MRRPARAGRLAAVLATVAIVVTACSSAGAPPSGGATSSDTGSPVLERIKKAGVLRAGYAAALPWLGQNPSNNEYFGPNDLIGKRLAEKLGVRLERVTQTFDQLIPALQAGTIDLAVAPMYMTETRLAAIAMSGWSKGGFCYLVRKDDNRINTTADLNNPEIRIANFEGTGGFQETKKKYPNAQQVTRAAAPGEEAMFLEVQQNKADAATFDNPLAVVYEKQFPDLKIVPPAAECLANPDISTDIGIGYPKDDPALKTYIEAIITEIAPNLKTELEKYSDPQYLKPPGG
jgi:polar amino acid transport system substrate-binding protein